MILIVELYGGGLVELQGTMVRYWKGLGEPDYVGPIAGLPAHVIAELIDLKAIK